MSQAAETAGRVELGRKFLCHGGLHLLVQKQLQVAALPLPPGASDAPGNSWWLCASPSLVF